MSVAGDRFRGVDRLTLPPSAGGAPLGGGRKVVLPEDDARGGGMQRRWCAKERLHRGRVATQARDQRGDVFGRAGAIAETEEPELEVDARLVRRNEIRASPWIAGLVAKLVRDPG